MGATVITWSVSNPEEQELLRKIGLVPRDASLDIQPGANPGDGHVKLLVHRAVDCVDTYEVDYDVAPGAPRVRLSGFKCGRDDPGSSTQVISVFSRSSKTPWVAELANLLQRFDTTNDPSLPALDDLSKIAPPAAGATDAPAPGDLRIGGAPSTGDVAEEPPALEAIATPSTPATEVPPAVAIATSVEPVSSASLPWLRIGVVSALGAVSAAGGWKTRGDYPLPSDGGFAAAGGAGGYALTRMGIGLLAPNWSDRHPVWAEVISVVAGAAVAFGAVQGNRSISGRGHQAVGMPDEMMPDPFVDEEAKRQPPEAEVEFGD
ncbi:MAG: hypothetical protein Q7S98_02195 [Deltaproteobacteria bacterium]|nr:hypothetical protein [Deltaproteobacteria bacterium]